MKVQPAAIMRLQDRVLGGVQTCTSDQSAQPRRFQASHDESIA